GRVRGRSAVTERWEWLTGFGEIGPSGGGHLRRYAHMSSNAGHADLRVLLESAPDAMVIVDERGTIALVNARAEELFGYGREELVGGRVEMLVPERFAEQHPAHRREYSADPHTRAMGAGLELQGRRKDGSEFPVEISLS